jgi:hypothetical protein
MELHHRVRLQTALHVVKDLAGPVTVPQEELEGESTHGKKDSYPALRHYGGLHHSRKVAADRLQRSETTIDVAISPLCQRLANGILNAIMDAFAAHSTMSKQALDSEKVRSGLKDVLLGPAQLYEALRARGDSVSGQTSATD